MKICCHQLMGSVSRVPGHGDCHICRPDENNARFPGYIPVVVHRFTVQRNTGNKKEKEMSELTSR